MTLEKGSLVLIDYTAKLKDTNQMFETTREEEAKKLDLYDATRKYEPRLVSMGEGWVLKG
jgi:peptidylprolyl isomerase